MKNSKYRKNEEKVFIMLMRAACGIIILIMGMILFSIVRRGLPSLNWKMLTSIPRGGYYFGGEGGILNAILGSIYLALGSTVLSLIISLPSALYLNIHLKKHQKLQNTIRLFIDVLWGIPSIVYGAFAFTVMIWFGLRASLLAGILTVTLFISPIMIRGMDEALKTIPNILLEAAYSLGSTRFETAYKVFLRQALPGIATAILLSFGRAIGDAASVLFTAGFTDNIPKSLTQPAATLPLSIFFQLSSPIAEVQERAYSAAIILTLIILIISITARTISIRYSRHDIK